jgi:Skp family chaperone for outer membrane proteins
VSPGGAAGRPVTVWLKSSAFAVALIGLAAFSASAAATTDRANYVAQVDPICVAANAQDQRLSAASEQEFSRIHRELRNAGERRREKLLARDRKLSATLPDQHLRIRYSELARLLDIAAAPGDEGLVSGWLDARKVVLDLSTQVNRLDRQVDRLHKRFLTTDLQLLNELDRKIRQIDQQIDKLENKLISAEDTELDLGTQLGATDCVNDVA